METAVAGGAGGAMAEEVRQQEEEDFPALLLEPARPKGPSASSSGGVGMGQPAPSAWSSSRAEDLRRGLAEARREEEEEEQRRRRRERGGASLAPGGLVSGSRVSLLTPLTRDFLRAPPVQLEPVAPPLVPNSDAADGPVAGGGGVGGGEGRGAGVAVSQSKARAGVAAPAGSSSHKCNERLRARMRDEWAQRLLDSKRAALEERLMRLEDERGARIRELWYGITTPDGSGRPRGGSVGSGDEQEEEGKEEREKKGGSRRAGEEATTKGWFEFLRPSGSVREPLVAKEVAMRPTKQLAAQVQEGEEEEVKGAADDFEVLEAVVRAGGKTVKDLQAVLARAYWDAREAQTRRNAFHVAAAEGRADLLEGLVAYAPQGVDSLDRRRMTPLLCAAEAGHTECVKLLLKRGAKADVRDRAGETGG